MFFCLIIFLNIWLTYVFVMNRGKWNMYKEEEEYVYWDSIGELENQKNPEKKQQVWFSLMELGVFISEIYPSEI